MAINDKDIRLKITVDDSGAVKVLNDFGGELEQVSSKAKKAGFSFTELNQALELGKKAFNTLIAAMDRARIVEGLSQGFENLQGGAAQAAVTLSKMQAATKGLVTDLDLMQQANQAVLLGLPTEGFDELAEAAVKLGASTGITATDALTSLVTGLGRASPLILDNLGITIKAAEAQELYAASLEKTVDQLTETQKAEAFRAAAIEKIKQKSAELTEVQETGAVAATRLTTSISNLTDEVVTLVSKDAALAKTLNLMADGIDRVTGALERYGRFDFEQLRLQGELKALFAEQQEIGFRDPRYFELEKQMDGLRVRLKKYNDQAPVAVKETKKLATELEEVATAASKASTALEAPKILGGGRVGGIMQLLFGSPENLINTGIGEQVGKNITDAIGQGIANIDLSDIRGSIAGLGGGIGQTVGAGLGTAIGGPIGTAIGSAIGDKIFTGVAEGIAKFGESTSGSVGAFLDAGALGGFSTLGFGEDIASAIGFGGKSARAQAIDAVDAFFEDLLDENRVSLVIDGQLQEIRDIAENDIGSFFEDLDISTAQGLEQFGGFQSIGNAISLLTGTFDEVGSDFGAVLGNAVGGSLNNLQLLLQQLNISQEDLAKGIEEAWLNGDISASQFLETGRDIENIYTQGIPDGLGLTDKAFQNLIESGGAGRQVIDALGDAAVEAEEKGISTLEGLRDDLIASGQDAEKVNKLFDALANAGITSLEQLKEVGTSTSAAIGAELEQTGNFFSDIKSELEETKRQLDEISSKEVDLTFNIRTNVDSNTNDFRDVIEGNAGGLPNEGAVQ